MSLEIDLRYNDQVYISEHMYLSLATEISKLVRQPFHVIAQLQQLCSFRTLQSLGYLTSVSHHQSDSLLTCTHIQCASRWAQLDMQPEYITRLQSYQSTFSSLTSQSF